MGLSRRGSCAIPNPFGLGFVGVVDHACHIPDRELYVSILESRSNETFLAAFREGPENESRKEDK